MVARKKLGTFSANRGLTPRNQKMERISAMNHRSLLIAALASLAAFNAAQARVKLVALPERGRVVISLSHPEATLVEEERVLPLQKGVNKVDFSWRGVNIDAASIQIRMLGHPDKVQVLNTSYPPNENALIWEISSPTAQEERIRISYLLAGLNRDVIYKAVAEPDEKTVQLRDYLRLRNDSGEDFAGAELTLGYGPEFKKDIANGEILEMQTEKIDGLGIKKILTWDAASQPWDPEYEKNTVGIPLSYVFTNSPPQLGQHTLLPGKARIFIKTGGEGVAFTGEDWVQLTPVDRECKLYIGQSRDVKVTQRKTKEDKTNIRRNTGNNVVMWDTDETIKIEIENFKKEPASLVVVERIPGYWKMVESTHEYKKKDAFTIEYHLTLPKESTGKNKTVVTLNYNRLNVQGNEPAAQQ
jgi:hypothetical protein